MDEDIKDEILQRLSELYHVVDNVLYANYSNDIWVAELKAIDELMDKVGRL